MKKLTPLTCLLLLTCFNVFSQKLKEVQETSILAPATVKIDGALGEWNDTFQAYNKATKLYYTLSNDDKNLYLVIKSTDPMNNNKITAGGITLAINSDDKKKEKDAYSLTYPAVKPFSRNMRGGGFGGPGGPGGGGGVRTMSFIGGGPGGPGGPGGTITIDSNMVKAAHERTIAAAKEIKISGFKSITDSLISIYNEYGIKAAINYDAKNNFTYELRIPLSTMGMSTNNPKEFAYNVKVNGLVLPNMPGMDEMMGGGGPGGPPGGGMRSITINGGPGGGMGSFQDMISPSDFWGKYTLAKK